MTTTQESHAAWPAAEIQTAIIDDPRPSISREEGFCRNKAIKASEGRQCD